MVMIPTLKTAFGCCSNRTGSKIVGWITLVVIVLGLIMIALPFALVMEVFWPMIGIAALTVFLFSILATILLLFGVYKNKSGYILLYLVLSVLGSAGFIYLIFSIGVSFDEQSLIIIAICLVHLYFTWVVYSFYQELRGAANKNIGLYIAPTDRAATWGGQVGTVAPGPGPGPGGAPSGPVFSE